MENNAMYYNNNSHSHNSDVWLQTNLQQYSNVKPCHFVSLRNDVNFLHIGPESSAHYLLNS